MMNEGLNNNHDNQKTKNEINNGKDNYRFVEVNEFETTQE